MIFIFIAIEVIIKEIMTYLEKTFCASVNCKNDCGRRMTEEELTRLRYLNSDEVSYDYFCGNDERRSIEDNS